MKQSLNRVTTVVDVEDAVAPVLTGAADLQEIAPEAERASDQTWGFIKNMHTKELIKFGDGTEFTFPSTFFITSDEELAENIRSVLGKYNIIENH